MKQNSNFDIVRPNLISPLFFNLCFDKGELKNLIGWFLEKYGEKSTIDFLEALKSVGFHQATVAGISLGLDDLHIPEQKSKFISEALLEMQNLRAQSLLGNITSVEKSQRMIDTWNQTSEFLRQSAIQNFRNTNPVNPVYMMAFSGARGNISQVRQLVAMRGLMADPQGAILEFPIQSNFREGLTLTEYLISCYGARKGLVDTALRTATSGYLTRRLVDAVQHVVVALRDCNTQKGVLLKNETIESHNLESRLIGRLVAKSYHIMSKTLVKRNSLISPTLAQKLAVEYQEILVRSPLTCEAENAVCQYCYGWNLAHGKLVNIGEAVGVIAAQSIGEPGTQLTMRTFHTGGVGVFADGGTKLFKTPFAGKVEFLHHSPGLVVRTPHGNIVYMLKHNSPVSQEKLLKISPLDPAQEPYILQEKDLPSGSILWVKQGEYVRPGQLIAQSSQIKKSKSQMPESLHPVESPSDGEIYFESMKIIRQKRRSIKREKKQAEISLFRDGELGPTNRTLLQLGSFWVFGTSTQNEIHTGKSFLRSGDLVSKSSRLFEYDLHFFEKAQLIQRDSQILLGWNYFNVRFSDIRFYKIGYLFTHRFNTKSSKNFDIFLYRKYTKKNSLGYSLIWYSSSFKINEPGYCSLLNHYFEYFKSFSNSFGIESAQNLGSFFGTFFWCPQKVFFGKTFSIKLKRKPRLLIFNHDKKIFSTTGLVQVQINQIKKNRLNPTKKSLHVFWKNQAKSPMQGLVPLHQKLPLTKKTKTFLFFALSRAAFPGFFESKSFFIKSTSSWIFIGNTQPTKVEKIVQLNGILLEPGKSLNGILFLNSSVFISQISSQSFTSTPSTVFDTKNTKKGKGENDIFSFYKPNDLLDSKSRFTLNIKRVQKDYSAIMATHLKNLFVFFTLKKQTNSAQTGWLPKPVLGIFGAFQRCRQIQFLVIEKASEVKIQQKMKLNKKWFSGVRLQNTININSPLLAKQKRSPFFTKKTPSILFRMRPPRFSNWVSSTYLFGIHVLLTNPVKTSFIHYSSSLRLVCDNQSIFPNSFTNCRPAFNIFIYDNLLLPANSTFLFKTFKNNWVIFNQPLTKGSIKISHDGEFRRLQTRQNESIASILSIKNLKTLQFLNTRLTKTDCLQTDSSQQIQIGSLLRWGDSISENFASHLTGQIIKLTSNNITVRSGIPFLASARGLVHIFHNDLIQKNQLLITLRSRRLQTEDIVQGIPKIEQLFEARETQGGESLSNNVHSTLQKFFISAVKYQDPQSAVLESIKKIQLFLIENILQAYSNQGVKISEKHVEIIVRQMTTRVRVLKGGDTGFLPGELVEILWIQELNQKIRLLGYREASYEPIVLGITKSVLQSESFLLAASFQEVSRVLVRSALTRKTDFLRGLHENVILGQLIPAGTGLILEPLDNWNKRSGKTLK